MGQKRPRLTKELIRKYFGRRASIESRWFADGYKVTTETGGEFLISEKTFEIVIPTDDGILSMTLLGNELWGSIKVNGSPEFIMAGMAHGEALGVNVRPGIKRGWFGRSVVIFFGFVGVMGAAQHNIVGVRILLIAAFVWWRMERSAKRKEQRLAAHIGYLFPRVHGTAAAATDEDLEDQNWV